MRRPRGDADLFTSFEIRDDHCFADVNKDNEREPMNLQIALNSVVFYKYNIQIENLEYTLSTYEHRNLCVSRSKHL